MDAALDTVRRHYEAFERADWPAVLASYDPEEEAT
jgi:ketosteroid isomerase-like protein